jgi:hypothetical protein
MSDIDIALVERLRNRRTPVNVNELCITMEAAATVIERQREELCAVLKHAVDLRAEIARLKRKGPGQ